MHHYLSLVYLSSLTFDICNIFSIFTLRSKNTFCSSRIIVYNHTICVNIFSIYFIDLF